MIKTFSKISIVSRLLILISMAFCIGFIALSFFPYHFLKKNFKNYYNDFFLNEIAVLQKILTKSGINTSAAIKQEVILEPEANNYQYFIQVSTFDNKSIIKTPGIDKVISPDHLNLATNKINLEPILIKKGKLTFLLTGTALKINHMLYKIVILLNISEDANILNQFKNTVVTISGIGIIIFLIIGVILIKICLRPLELFIKKIKTITPNTLEPLILKQLPFELELLMVEINQLIIRTKLSYENISSFSSNIAHELRTPINNLMISNEMLLLKKNQDLETKIQILSNIEEYQRLSALIDKLLFLARLSANDKKFRLRILNLEEEINKVVEFHEAMAQEKRIQITTNISGSIYADQDLFHHALANVLTNALKYSSKHSRITICAKKNKNTTIVSVSDQGIGIPDADLAKVTERFYRVDKNRSANTGGLGLGLSIVKSIMLALGGELDIKNNKPVGLTVNLIFQKSNALV